jgi:hypothetical protein
MADPQAQQLVEVPLRDRSTLTGKDIVEDLEIVFKDVPGIAVPLQLARSYFIARSDLGYDALLSDIQSIQPTSRTLYLLKESLLDVIKAY